MLIDGAYRYIELRRSLGFKLRKTSAHLASFAEYAASVGDVHVRSDTALAWASATSSTQDSYYRRLQELALFARFLRAEDAGHEVPQHHLFYRPRSRPAPYIFSPEEVARMLTAARELRSTRLNPLKPHTHEMLFGLIAATGLRISEALKLRLDDVLATESCISARPSSTRTASCRCIRASWQSSTPIWMSANAMAASKAACS
jgi:site-specific recombinase XerD